MTGALGSIWSKCSTTHDLAVKHGVSLKSISLDGMAADIELAKQLQPIEDELRTALTLAMSDSPS